MPDVTPSQALQRLREGNARFLTGDLTRPHQDESRRQALSSAQDPFAIILGCADSRVPPELLFDQGLGDLFTVRVAGQVVDDVVLESLMFSVEQLGTPLVLVLGHTRCGAVEVAVAQIEQGDAPKGTLVGAIAPAVKAVKDEAGDLVDNAVRQHVQHTVTQLKEQAGIAARLGDSLAVAGAIYNLKTGRVNFL